MTNYATDRRSRAGTGERTASGRRRISAPAFLGFGALGIVVYQLLPADALVVAGIVLYFVIGLAGVAALTHRHAC